MIADETDGTGGLLTRGLESEPPEQLQDVERVGPVLRPRLPAPLAVGSLQGEQACTPAVGRDLGPLGRDGLRGRVLEVAHDLPADRWIGVEQPIDDGHIPLSQALGCIPYSQGMTESYRLGPDHDAVVAYIVDTFPGVDLVSAMNATFFSIDPETHWPNFATLVTTDEHDEGAPSDLDARPDVYRLNIGVSRETFDRLVGGATDPEYAALDRLLPHPVYARQHWLSILSPSAGTFDDVVKPLLQEAYDRLVAARDRHKGPEPG